MMRTHRCGDLRTGQIGEKVSVCGWVASRRDHGGVVFLDVRDAAGIVQVVVDPDTADGAGPHQLRAEYVKGRLERDVRSDVAVLLSLHLFPIQLDHASRRDPGLPEPLVVLDRLAGAGGIGIGLRGRLARTRRRRVAPRPRPEEGERPPPGD